jgi:hypothetical protein
MQLRGLQKTFEISGEANRMRRGPFEFQQQHGVISHSARAANDGLDGGVERFDDAKANGVKAVRGDDLEMPGQERAQLLHLWQALPAQRLDPGEQKIADSLPGLVRQGDPVAHRARRP